MWVVPFLLLLPGFYKYAGKTEKWEDGGRIRVDSYESQLSIPKVLMWE